MNILEAQEKAKDDGEFDSQEFIAHFPAGPTKCKWLDAYFGMFKIEGYEGFVMVGDIREHFPNLEVYPA